MIRPLHMSFSHHYQRGVNLIEIMVAMVIGLFLVIGATSLYVSTTKTSKIDDAIGLLQENARYALSVIETDVRMANYWGLTKDGSIILNKSANKPQAGSNLANALSVSPSGNYCGADYAANSDSYIEATNNRYNFLCTANIPAATSADTLTIRRVNTQSDKTGGAASAPADGLLQLCSTFAGTAQFVVGAGITCTNGELHNVVVNGYFVAQGSDQSASYPSLRRKALGVDTANSIPNFTELEIVPGVEDMQIELGWDNSSTDVAGAVQYVQPEDAVLSIGTCTAAGTGAGGPCEPAGRIVSVRVWLLIRAENPDPTFTDNNTYSYADRTGAAKTALTAGMAYKPGDHYRRLLVSRTFFIRNVTGV